MANLDETGAGEYNWEEEGVYQLEITDRVMAGAGGIANRQATDLAKRTRNLHDRLSTAETQKAPLNSPALSGTPTAPTAATATNNTQVATTAFVKAVVAALVDSSPGALDTLNELATALNDDPNFATTVTNALAGKLAKASNLSDLTNVAVARGNLGLGAVALLASISIGNVTGLQSALNAKAPVNNPALSGTPTAPTAAGGTNTNQIATTAFVQAALNSLGLGDIFESPVFSGTPTTPTPAPGTNTQQVASTAFVQAAIAALVDSSPGALDTLNELAAALNDDPNFATTITNALAGKLSKSGGTMDVGALLNFLTSNNDINFLRVGEAAGYGFYFRYTGSQSGNDNALELWSENSNGTHQRIFRAYQNGVISFDLNIGIDGGYVWNSKNFNPDGKENAFNKNSAFNKNFGSAAGTVCQGNDSRLSNERTPTNSSVHYAKVSNNLKNYATLSSGNVDLSANGGGNITLVANTAFSFSSFELNKSYLLTVNTNGFTPSFADGSKHVPVEGNADLGTDGVYYIALTCIDSTAGNEKLLTAIMKGA